MIIAASSYNLCANPIDEALHNANFIEAGIPVKEALSKANNSRNEYYVSKETGIINIQLITPEYYPPKSNSFKSKSIDFIGTNHGEWGGELIAKWPDGKTKKINR